MNITKVAQVLATLALTAAILFILLGNSTWASIFGIIFFLAVAIFFQGHSSLKGFSYTVIILASFLAALSFPHLFTKWGNFNLSVLIVPSIQLIMFGMGTSMGIKDFVGVVKSPKGVFIGVVSHFIVMPLIGFALANISGLPAEIAAGIILVGCSPNGMASNVISYLARANVALSITITAISTLLSPFLTPVLMKLLAGSFIEINAWHMMWDIMKIVIIPIGAGLLFNRLFQGKAMWMNKVMPYVSMFGVAFSIVVIAAAGRDNLLSIGPLLIGLVLIHNISGYFLGYWSARLFKMTEQDCRTVAIEVGMQNAGLASGIAKALGKIASIGLAPAVFGPLMNITGSLLASWWHRKSPKKS